MRHPSFAPRPPPPARGRRFTPPATVVVGALFATVLFADLGLFALGCASAPEDRLEMAAERPSPVPPGHQGNVRPVAWEELAGAGFETSGAYTNAPPTRVGGGQGEAPDVYTGKIVLSDRIDGVHFHLILDDAAPGRYALELYRAWTCEAIERERAALPPATERVSSFLVDEEGHGETEGVIAWDAGEVPFVSLARAEAPLASPQGEPPSRGVVPSALLIVQETVIPRAEEDESPFVSTTTLPVGTGCIDLDL